MAGNWRSGAKKDPKSGKSLRRNSDHNGGTLDVRQDPLWKKQERRDIAYAKFARKVGGVKGLKELASYAQDNPKVGKLLELIDDPRYRTYGIKALSKRCGLTLPELINLFRTKHFAELFMEFFDGAPQIAKDTVEDAKARMEMCPMCEREGFIMRKEVKIPCPKCKSKGEIRIAGDKDARRDVFKAVGIHTDSPMVQVNTNINVEGVDDFEELMKAAKPTAKIIDVTPVRREE